MFDITLSSGYSMLEKMEEYDFIIIGAGLGGLLTGALLANDGQKIIILERLRFPGGKYTSITYQECEIPTAAHHMIPTGKQSPIYKICQDLGLQLPLLCCRPALVWRVGDKDYAFPFRLREVFLYRPCVSRLLNWREKLAVISRFFRMLLGDKPSVGRVVDGLVHKITDNDLIHRSVNKMIQFSCSVDYSQINARQMLEVIKRQRFSAEAVVDGGLKVLINLLEGFIESKGGRIKTQSEVKRVLIDGKRASGVELTDGQMLGARQGVISNAGVRGTYNLIQEKELISSSYIKKMNDSIPAWGVNYVALLENSVLGRGGVVILTDCQFLAGASEPTFYSPRLCPDGRTLLIAYQVLDQTKPLEQQIEGGKREFLALARAVLPEQLIVSIFHGNWPGVEIAPVIGQTGEGRMGHDEIGIQELWTIGADNIGEGIAGDMVGDSVRILYERLKPLIEREN